MSPVPKKKPKNAKLALSQGNDLLSPSKDNPGAERSKIKSEFLDASLSNIGELLDQFSQSNDIPLRRRLDFVNNIKSLATKWADELTPKVPDKAPALWAERGKENRYMCPCDFVIEHYPSYGFGLTITDILHLDEPLYTALRNWVKKHGSWPDGFYLPTKKELSDQRLAEMTESQIGELRVLADASRKRNNLKSLKS